MNKEDALDYLKKRKKRLDTPAPKVIIPKTHYNRKKKKGVVIDEETTD